MEINHNIHTAQKCMHIIKQTSFKITTRNFSSITPPPPTLHPLQEKQQQQKDKKHRAISN